jgi:FKBP-type peptidyl-prolyl cis-trans isomerase
MIEINEIEPGDGPEAKHGSKLTVHYIGRLTDGTKFDSSYDRGKPFEVTLGTTRIISGFELGLTGMKKGGKRKITIPPEMAYGERGTGPIPPNSTLIFELELVDIG